jgi:uncharacterized protein
MPRTLGGTLPLVTEAARQSASLRETAHRPWPLPETSWIQGQTWESLLFAHRRVPAVELRPLVPEPLILDEYDGSAWVGVTPFRVTGLRIRGTLPVPVLSAFLELNVRTYVTVGDRAGIWFFSLDAASRLAVEAARRTYRLPYHHARMDLRERGGWIEYSCTRDPSHAFEGRYRPSGPPFEADADSLEHFLTERYCLYSLDEDGGLATADIHHRPWQLQAAEAEIEVDTMPPDGLRPTGEPLLHFSARQDVVIWPLRPGPDSGR